MDDLVLKAMQRWPDVPAVDGWLTLDARGRWKIHPSGGGNRTPPEPGEVISNAGLIAYINRNYAVDERGRWFFQNGPQRVYVRLEAAPYIVRLADDGFGLQTHTGLQLESVDEWVLTDTGHLYLRTPRGAGCIEDRDLAPLLAALTHLPADQSPADTLPDGPCNLLDALEAGQTRGLLAHPRLPVAPWRQVGQDEIPRVLGFSPQAGLP